MIKLAKTKYGIYQSVVSNAGFALFRGIPYAKAPVNDLRWKPPVQPECFEGIRVCDRYGDACAQFDRWDKAIDDITDDSGHSYIMIDNYPYPPKMSEDCLYLNIYTPAVTDKDNLPVMIYIHGGGLQQWYGSDYEYCGDNFCRQNVILVSINYRLNVFGYFCHPQLAEESEHNSSGNYGLMDQIMAIKWVRENIRAFGGDPDNITLFGQSAGGRSCLAILCSPLAENMVSRVSIQSAGGIGTVTKNVSYKKQLLMGEQFMKNLGCENIEQLRKLDWQIIRDENDRLGFFNGFNLCTDGYVLPKDIDEMVINGEMADVDVIIGCTVDEGVNDKPPMFNVNMYAQARAFASTREKSSDKSTYLYVFDRPQPGDDAGTPHSCDNRYQFGTLDGSWRPYTVEDWNLSLQMQKYWANFAHNGNPNGKGLPYWQKYDKKALTMKLCVEGCYMEDYNRLTDGKFVKMEKEIIDNLRKKK